METYPLKVGGGKRRGVSSHAHKELLVSVIAEHGVMLTTVGKARKTHVLNVGGSERRGIPNAFAQSFVSFWRS